MPAYLRMARSMPIRRAITAQRDPAALASTQMHPARAELDAFLAFMALLVFDGLDLSEMGAGGFGVHAFSLLFIEHLVDKGDGNRALSDRGRDPLDIAGAHVADGEYAWQTRFK